MEVKKNALLPLAVVGGLVAVVAIAVAGNGDDPDARAAKAPPAEEQPAADPDAPALPAKYKSNLCKRLRCTVEQDDQVLDVIKSHRTEASARGKEAQLARRELAALYAADEFDDEAVRAVFAKVTEAENEVQLSAYESIVTLHALLSPEQREAFGQMLARQRPEEILGKPGGRGKKAGREGKRGRKSARGAARGRDAGARDAQVAKDRDRAAGRERRRLAAERNDATPRGLQ